MLVSGREPLVVQALPGVHARGLLGALLPPVMGAHAIAQRHRHIDVAIVHLGVRQGVRQVWSRIARMEVREPGTWPPTGSP